VSHTTVQKARRTNWQSVASSKAHRPRWEEAQGLLLKEMEKAKGARGNPNGRGAKIVRSNGATTQKTLADLGVSKDQSSRWQQLAENPKAVERYLRRYVHGTEAAPSALETASRWCPFRNR